MKKMKLRKPPSQRPNRALQANAIECNARHEAGHAVAAIALGLPLVSVDIIARERKAEKQVVGYTELGASFRPESFPDRKDRMAEGLKWLIQVFAGQSAEHTVNPNIRHADVGDLENAQKLALISVCNSTKTPGGLYEVSSSERSSHALEIVDLMKEAMLEANGFAEVYNDALRAVASQLVERKSLTGVEVAGIVQQHPPRE